MAEPIRRRINVSRLSIIGDCVIKQICIILTISSHAHIAGNILTDCKCDYLSGCDSRKEHLHVCECSKVVEGILNDYMKEEIYDKYIAGGPANGSCHFLASF